MSKGYWIFNREEELRQVARYLAQHAEMPTAEVAAMLAKPDDIDDGREYLSDPQHVAAIQAHNPALLLWVEEDDDA